MKYLSSSSNVFQLFDNTSIEELAENWRIVTCKEETTLGFDSNYRFYFSLVDD